MGTVYVSEGANLRDKGPVALAQGPLAAQSVDSKESGTFLPWNPLKRSEPCANSKATPKKRRCKVCNDFVTSSR